MSATRSEFWRSRIDLPAYRVGEAARYARTTAQTIGNWQRARGNRVGVIGARDSGAALSYLQLIEVGVVAAMRKSGVTLPKIRQAREYLSTAFSTEFPFAQYKFKTYGKQIIMDYEQVLGKAARDKLLVVSENGQFAWNHLMGNLLREFDYTSDDDLVITWKVDGIESPVSIDPRVAFGSPHVGGIATWALKERWESGESIADIADDYDLSLSSVFSALRFEGVDVDADRPSLWVH